MHFALRGMSTATWYPWVMLVAIILSIPAARAQTPTALPGTKLLEKEGNLAEQMRDDVDRFLLRLIAETQHADLAGRDSLERQRRRFANTIGAVDPRVEFRELEHIVFVDRPTQAGSDDRVTIRAVRWPVLDGVTGEGLLLDPIGKPKAFVVALPDADWTPESIAGLQEPPIASAAYAWNLALNGCRVLVPTLIDRQDTWSGNPAIRSLNQPHREYVYRPAFYLGRHIIGYEVQKVLNGIDYFAQLNAGQPSRTPIGVAGYGEGGLIAFYAAAVDTRIQAALVSGYFQQRSDVWREPICRNVWGLLRDFGDARIAQLVAPRRLVIEACRGVEIDGPPAPHPGDRSYAATGVLRSPSVSSVRAEFNRVEEEFDRLGQKEHCRLVVSGDGSGSPGSREAIRSFLGMLGLDAPSLVMEAPPAMKGPRLVEAEQRMRRQVDELVRFNQNLFWESSRKRAEYWKAADRSSVENWTLTTDRFRQHLLDDVIGNWEIQKAPLNVRTRSLYETDGWTGYEVTLDVAPNLWAYGILLIPKSLQPSRRAPVVIAQHGRGGHPQDVCDPARDSNTYHHYGATLADRGYIVFAPQHLYFGEEKYRQIQRKANVLGLSFFAPMVWQHRALLAWLQSLDFVDPARIGFYGISYGGKSALLIPAVLEEYALSICSGAFTDTVRKHIDSVGGNRSVFLFTNEYEHLEFDFAEKFNHAELAWLISPRPFMVEKGHWDGGLPDEWTAFEYARVRRHYVQLGIAERTAIEFFPGRHEINEAGTYEFLDKHLKPGGE